MKNALVVILLAIASLDVFSQGTNEVKLINFTQSTCDEKSDPDRLRTRIVKQEYIGGVLKIEVGFKEICCASFIPQIEFKNDTLHLKYKIGPEICFCDCCYQVIYHIVGLEQKDFKVTLQGKPIQLSDEKYTVEPIEFEIYNNDTINLIDKYGFEQGLHIKGKDKTKPVIRMEYLDGKAQNGYIRNSYYENGQVKYEIVVNNGVERTLRYYSNGQIKEECYTNEYKGPPTCTEWTEDGKKVNNP